MPVTTAPGFPVGIGELSRQTGCHIETIRYYEKQGMMPKPPRSAGGHRLYGPDHLKRLTFIRRCRDLGFTMAQITELLSLVDEHCYTCHDIREITLGHVEEIRGKLSDLKRLEKVLLGIAAGCTNDAAPECPIVDALYEPLGE